ncbi:MAG: sugar phosphate isomerase/epimerase [Clostridia bacterium]|nr:sugar phosphate isomerase/epimerase [Clostridia bacterium]
MKNLGINFENVLSIKEELNITTLEALKKIKDLGFSSLDVKYERLVENNLNIKDILSAGFTISSIFSFCPFFENDNIQKALKMVDFAFENKIKEIMFLSDFKKGGYTLEDAKNVKKNLRRVVNYASGFNVIINIENVGNIEFPFNDVKTTLDYLESVKGLGLVFDDGNFILNDVNPLEAIKVLSPYVRRYHLKNRVLKNSEVDFVETTSSGVKSFVASLGEYNATASEVYNVIKKHFSNVPLVIEFPALEKKLYEKVKKSAMYAHTEIM